MKRIKILHMYYDLMNLYGDWANTAVLGNRLTELGSEVLLDKKSVGDDIDFGIYDFIYIGSGTERSQLACMRDLEQYKESLLKQIEAGVPVLATGNSHELFGKAVTDSAGNRHAMLGLLDFETEQKSTRVTGDCICDAAFLPDKLIGFINRAGGSQKGTIKRPFSVTPGTGAGFSAFPEGIHYKNLLGTYLTGPVLVRNPPLLRYTINLITTREVMSETEDSTVINEVSQYLEQAYETALSAM